MFLKYFEQKGRYHQNHQNSPRHWVCEAVRVMILSVGVNGIRGNLEGSGLWGVGEVEAGIVAEAGGPHNYQGGYSGVMGVTAVAARYPLLTPPPPPARDRGHWLKEFNNLDNYGLVDGGGGSDFSLGSRPLCPIPHTSSGNRRWRVPLCGHFHPHCPCCIGW